MRRQQQSLTCLLRQRQGLAPLLVVGVLGMLGPAAPALSQDGNNWTGEGADNLWSTAENWFFEEVPTYGEIVLGVEAEGGNGPIIQDGIDAIVGVLIAAVGEPVVTMTGGTLELTEWGIWWGDWAGTNATFNMSGGEILFTGSPGILEMGWLDDEDATPGNSEGTWNISGGEIYAKGISMPTECPDNRCFGTINLTGGTLNVGVEREGLVLREGALIDIAGGALVLEGDQTIRVEDYLDLEYITAYGGGGELFVTYDEDDDLTFVTAGLPQMPGDYNNNEMLDAGDLDLQASEGIALQDLAYDLNGDSIVDYEGDRVMWLHELKKVPVGDADLNGSFTSDDFVTVFTGGLYETGSPATWIQGDWDGDLVFDSNDFVAAFIDGYYEQQDPLGGGVAAVPEPSAVILILLGLAGLLGRARHFQG